MTKAIGNTGYLITRHPSVKKYYEDSRITRRKNMIRHRSSWRTGQPHNQRMVKRTSSFVNNAVVNLSIMNVSTVVRHAAPFLLTFNKTFQKMTKDKQNTHA